MSGRVHIEDGATMETARVIERLTGHGTMVGRVPRL